MLYQTKVLSLHSLALRYINRYDSQSRTSRIGTDKEDQRSSNQIRAIRSCAAKAMASVILKRTSSSALNSMVDALRIGASYRGYAKLAVGNDIVSVAPDVSLQKARTWDEGVSSKFSTTPLTDIFKGKKVVIFGLPGAYTGVCSQQHVPSYKNNIEKFKAKGIDSVICVAVNDPFAMNGWAEKLQAKDEIEFYGDFDGKFHKSLELDKDLSVALLGPRSQRWSAYVDDGKVKVLNVEEVPSDFKVSGAEVILGQI